jgi:hypothetical protein
VAGFAFTLAWETWKTIALVRRESTLEEWKEPKAHNELQNRASR